MSLAGALFLLIYGGMRFLAAWRGQYRLSDTSGQARLWPVLLTGFALTWLNPHVYLDTLGLIGAVSTQYSEINQKTAFGVAAMASSFVFFFSLGYGARLLSPVMQTARAWRVLDVLIGIVMWLISAGLVMSVV